MKFDARKALKSEPNYKYDIQKDLTVTFTHELERFCDSAQIFIKRNQ